MRWVHAKAHGSLRGRLTVAPGRPPELAQGMFATPGEHEVYMRLSTNAGDVLPDAVGLPRGLAMKVLDVEGERLPGAEGRAQDFIMINGPVFQNKNAHQFLGNLKLLICFVGVIGLTVLSGMPIAFSFGLATFAYLSLATTALTSAPRWAAAAMWSSRAPALGSRTGR